MSAWAATKQSIQVRLKSGSVNHSRGPSTTPERGLEPEPRPRLSGCASVPELRPIGFATQTKPLRQGVGT